MKRKVITITAVLSMATMMLGGCGASNNSTTAGSSKATNEAETNEAETQTASRPGLVSDTIYTHRSNGENVYSGDAISINGSINGKDIGKIGTITADGTLELNIPETIPDEQLDTQEGTDVLGGTLTMTPGIFPWESDEDMMVLVYVNADFGEYKQGWNYANMSHNMVPDTEGYKWVIMDDAAN